MCCRKNLNRYVPKVKCSGVRGQNVPATLTARDAVAPLISKDRLGPLEPFSNGHGRMQLEGPRATRCPMSAEAQHAQSSPPGRSGPSHRSAYLRQALARFFLIRYSALATRINSSSSLIGIQDVNTFIAFSKSESSKISLVASISAADVACNTSKSPLNLEAGKLEYDLSPNSMNTSHTRSWAGKGSE